MIYRNLLTQAQDKRKEAELKVVESQKIVDSLKQTLHDESQTKDFQVSSLHKSLETITNENAHLKELNKNLIKNLNARTEETRSINQNLVSVNNSKHDLHKKVEDLQKQIRYVFYIKYSFCYLFILIYILNYDYHTSKDIKLQYKKISFETRTIKYLWHLYATYTILL